jgi:hypothetical protein
VSLADTQRLLAEAFRQPRALASAPTARSLEEIVRGNERLTPIEQLDIYREQFWLRHVDVLRDDFASIERLVGGEAFEELARAYLAARPSASFTLRDLGAELPAFVADTAPWAADPLVFDLARVEWAFVEAFDGPDALAALDPSALPGVTEDAWPAATIGLHPALQRLTLAHPAHDYRAEVRKNEPAERPERRRCHVVVYRGPEVLHAVEVEADAGAILDALAAGTPLGEACVRVAEASGAPRADFEAKLGGWFSDWTALGWIRAVSFATGNEPTSGRRPCGTSSGGS